MIQRNIRFKWENFFGGLCPVAALITSYFQEIICSYASAMLVFSVSSLCHAATEIPAGIFSGG